MSPVLNRGPGTSAQSKENQVSASTTTHQNVFTVQQIQPQAAHSTATFFAVISRRSQG